MKNTFSFLSLYLEAPTDPFSTSTITEPKLLHCGFSRLVSGYMILISSVIGFLMFDISLYIVYIWYRLSRAISLSKSRDEHW